MNFVVWCCLFEVSYFYFTFWNVWISILSIIENTFCPAIIFWTLCHQVHQGNIRLQKNLEVNLELLHQQYVCTCMKFRLKRAWTAGSVCESNAVLIWRRSILWMWCWHVSIRSFCISYRLKVQSVWSNHSCFFGARSDPLWTRWWTLGRTSWLDLMEAETRFLPMKATQWHLKPKKLGLPYCRAYRACTLKTKRQANLNDRTVNINLELWLLHLKRSTQGWF